MEDQRVKLGCVQPGESAAVFGEALRRLSDRAAHLYTDNTRYWYSVQPTLLKRARDRAEQFEDEDVQEEIDPTQNELKALVRALLR